MEELAKYIAVYLTGAAGIYKGVPLGLAMGLSPVESAVCTALGSISLIVILFFAGDRFRSWLMNKFGQKKLENNKKKFTKWMDKYGVAALGLMVTGLIGPILSLLIGMMVLTERKKFLFYMIAGILLWTFALTYLADPLIQWIKQLF
nr:small multi-drug export protein [uncultured Carboxylicivirga sp.]